MTAKLTHNLALANVMLTGLACMVDSVRMRIAHEPSLPPEHAESYQEIFDAALDNIALCSGNIEEALMKLLLNDDTDTAQS